jgi:acetyl-CoA carboxylase carboxyl transferase subunit alpha
MRTYLDFEKPVAELEAKVEELRAMAGRGNATDIADDIGRLRPRPRRRCATSTPS